MFAYPINEAGDEAQPSIAWILATESVVARAAKTQAQRTSAYDMLQDHDAENAIPFFLCVANRKTAAVAEHSRAIDMANAISAAVERGQRAEPAAHVR